MGDLKEEWNVDLFKSDVKRVVSRISRIPVEELDEHLLIREELGIDSLMAMEIVATLEKLLGLKIDEALFATIQTVGDFLNLLVGLSLRKAS